MLNYLLLNASSSRGKPPLSLPLIPSITVFVGPNNSGKSQLLREIHQYCHSGSEGGLILKKLGFCAVDESTAEADLRRLVRQPAAGEIRNGGQELILTPDGPSSVYLKHYMLGRTNPVDHPSFAADFVKWFTVNLDGPSRTQLTAEKPQGNLTAPHNSFARMYTDDFKRESWRSIVHKAFGLYPALTTVIGGQISMYLGASPPPSERSHEQAIIDWVKAARPVEALSDGVKAFTGILLESMAGDRRIITVDEPEAFLHPTLARRLGRALADAARSEGKFIFAATHSPEFLMGAIQSGATVNIIRLTYSGGVGTARLLPNDELRVLMQDPLLRSAGVLAGLFCDHVVVTEADVDRAFYQEVNERLLAASDPRAVPDTIFLNADNHQTMPAIVEPLRRLGVPTAAIPDIDVVKRGGEEWNRQLRSCGLPPPQHSALQNQRKVVLDDLVAAAPSGAPEPTHFFKTNGGTALLDKTKREHADNFFDQLDAYGLFVVREGEVESWLQGLGVPKNKKFWRSKIFEAMGSNPSGTDYVGPAPGDVWDFMGRISSWLTRPDRKGMPD